MPYALDPPTPTPEIRNPRGIGAAGVWRFRDALPVTTQISLGEADTPLVKLNWGELELFAKLESLLPTGSFKDRGSAVLISWFVDRGARRVIADSSGNLGASIAAYSARAGLECHVYAPASASSSKLAQIRAYGAALISVEGSRSDVAEEAQAAVDGASAYASHAWSPVFLAGTQTYSFELFDQLSRKIPTAIIFPLGAGTLFLGAYYGFKALWSAGHAESIPKFFGIQVSACAPLARAFANGDESPSTVPTVGSTAAEGILTTMPPRGREILAVARATGGAILEIPEHSLLAASRSLAREGVYAEPTSAVAFAGLRYLEVAGLITPDDTIVVPVTGHGLKTPAG
jgi:threonine synthase